MTWPGKGLILNVKIQCPQIREAIRRCAMISEHFLGIPILQMKSKLSKLAMSSPRELFEFSWLPGEAFSFSSSLLSGACNPKMTACFSGEASIFCCYCLLFFSSVAYVIVVFVARGAAAEKRVTSSSSTTPLMTASVSSSTIGGLLESTYRTPALLRSSNFRPTQTQPIAKDTTNYDAITRSVTTEFSRDGIKHRRPLLVPPMDSGLRHSLSAESIVDLIHEKKKQRHNVSAGASKFVRKVATSFRMKKSTVGKVDEDPDNPDNKFLVVEPIMESRSLPQSPQVEKRQMKKVGSNGRTFTCSLFVLRRILCACCQLSWGLASHFRCLGTFKEFL